MNALKRFLPNIITLSNLTCGLFSIIFAFEGDLKTASLCVFAGALLDFFDGLIARLLKASSNLGKQLDSMADMITFGVAPAFIIFHFMFYIDNAIIFRHSMNNQLIFAPASLALLTPILAAYRLAKFNIDERQTTSFIGLPTPALAIFLASIPHINADQFPMFFDINFLAIIVIIMPLLLITKIPLFSMKINQYQNFYSQLNIFRITLLLSAIALFLVFKFAAIPFIVILYIILSVLNNIL